MAHRDFLRAVGALAEAYAILSATIAEALPAQLVAIAAVDPLTRITLEQFGDPFVHWFRRGSQVRGVHVADGTIVFEAGDDALVLFLSGVAAEHDDELPADWRGQATEVGRMQDGALMLR